MPSLCVCVRSSHGACQRVEVSLLAAKKYITTFRYTFTKLQEEETRTRTGEAFKNYMLLKHTYY